jgi:predicted RNase H-like HicB family nuclease
MRFLVIIRRTSTGYSVDVPELPGCVATGMNIEHAKQLIAEAIEMHIELMQQSGESIPAPSTTYEFAVDDSSHEEFCTWVEVESRQSAVS